jgi:putative glutamine amidotransferase
MSSKRPNIGVTGPDKGGTAAWWFTSFALRLHGANPIRIHPNKGIPEDDIHGLVIGGGADINPKWYGDTEVEDLFSEDESISGMRQFVIRLATIFFFPLIYLIRKLFSTSESGIDNRRDELEFELLERGIESSIPVLGICRGAQLINIYQGGTLYGDITDYYTEVPRVNSVWPKKQVRLDRNSRLYQLLEHRVLWVNAMHHQAVDELGDDLQVVAREENGIIQAIESKTHTFLIGVQWHPEYMPQIPSQRKLFAALVEQARNGTGQ